MGWLFYLQKEYNQALVFLRQTWRISYYIYGNNAGVTLVVLDDIQDVLQDQGLSSSQILLYCQAMARSFFQEQEADDLLENDRPHPALQIYQRILTRTEHPSGLLEAQLQYKIGSILRKQGQSEQALSCYCRALMTFQSILGKDHPSTLNARNLSAVVAKTEIVPMMTPPPKIPFDRLHGQKWCKSVSFIGRRSKVMDVHTHE